MSQLSGFSKYMKFSNVKVDQTFTESMQQLNSSQAGYIFPTNAKIINKKGQILEWEDSVDEYLFPNKNNPLLYEDFDGMKYYQWEDSDDTIEAYTIKHLKSWDYNTQFIDSDTGKSFSVVNIPQIELSQTDGLLKIPIVVDHSGSDILLNALNCTLDITHLSVTWCNRIYVLFSTPTETGKILMTVDQKDMAVSYGKITEVEGVLWLDGKIRVEVVQP